MREHTPEPLWRRLLPTLLIWVAAPAPLYIWLILWIWLRYL